MYVHRQEHSLNSHVFYLTPRLLLFPGCLLCTRHLTPFHPSPLLIGAGSLFLVYCEQCLLRSTYGQGHQGDAELSWALLAYTCSLQAEHPGG